MGNAAQGNHAALVISIVISLAAMLAGAGGFAAGFIDFAALPPRDMAVGGRAALKTMELFALGFTAADIAAVFASVVTVVGGSCGRAERENGGSQQDILHGLS